jgi:hypothetical protein
MTINNGDNTVTERSESALLITHISQSEQEVIIRSLKDVDPISYHYFFNFFIGKTKDGHICYFPESYRKGYLDFLDDKDLRIGLELYAMGQTSTGEWVYLPSYFQGVYAAKNELRFALLAEGQRRLFDETKKGKQALQKQAQSCEDIIVESSKNKETFSRLQQGYEELVSENKNLRHEIEKQQELADAYKKEMEGFRSQLEVVRNMSIETERRQHENSTASVNSNERKGDKRRRAAPIP